MHSEFKVLSYQFLVFSYQFSEVLHIGFAEIPEKSDILDNPEIPEKLEKNWKNRNAYHADNLSPKYKQ